jgi:outer membrane receptor protein involved in Fe transport
MAPTPRLARALILVAIAVLPVCRASAQVSGSIAGIVRDPSGAILPGVTVTVTGPSLQRQSASTMTDAGGAYRISPLPAGVYSLRFELSGFAPTVQANVEVAVDQQVTLDVKLGVAGVTEAVEVSTAVPLVEPTRSDLNARVSSRTIDALPLNGRNFVDLVALAPGARPVPEGQQGTNVSIFGERGAAVSFLVDGADNNNALNGGPALRYAQDAVQEFEVNTSGYEAEFGRAQGGVVNVITRSGTNAFDGRAFWFRRDDALDSSNVKDQDVPKLSRNQWGGTLGGPVQRDRLFFFGSFERLDETRGVNINRAAIPDFVASGLATPGGVEDFSIGPETGAFTFVGKGDAILNPSHRLSVTVNANDQDVTGEISSPVAGTTALPSAARTESANGYAVLARETALFGTGTFLETTAGYTDTESGTNLDRTVRAEPILVLLRSGFLQTGAPFGGKIARDPNRFQVAQSLTHTADWHGGHQVKVGWDFNRLGVTGSNEVTNDVEYSAAFLYPNAHAINEELFRRLGFAQSAARFFTLSNSSDGNLNVDIHSNDLSLYGQDTWQAASGVTINAGVRYDYASLFGDDKNNFGPRLGLAWDVGDRHQTIVKANWGLFFDRNVLSAAATVPEKGGIFTRSAFDVALPRLGADYTDSLIDLVITSGFPTGPTTRTPAENPAYRSFADALRANPLALYNVLGIGVSNPSAPPVVTADNVQQLSGKTPAQVVALLESIYPGTDWEFFDVPGGSVVGDRVLSFFPRGPLAFSRDVSLYQEDRTPWTRAFTIGVDQQLGADFSVSATYVHRRTRDLLTRRITNLYDVPPGNPNFGQTTDGGPRISAVTYDGLINYDGVVLVARKRFTDRYQFMVSYTGSRARDNLLTGDVGSTFSNNNHPEIEYGPSNQSVPHILVANGLVALPWDLRVSGITFWRSGSAFNPRGIQDLDGDGLVDQRDTSEPRNAFRTDPYADVDLRVEKLVKLPGQSTVSVLIEAFNLFNRANVASVTDVAGDSFGTPTTYFPGRELQIGLRYLFGRR